MGERRADPSGGEHRGRFHLLGAPDRSGTRTASRPSLNPTRMNASGDSRPPSSRTAQSPRPSAPRGGSTSPNGERGISIGMRGMIEEYPNGLSVDLDTRRMHAYTWPPDHPPKGFQRASPQADGGMGGQLRPGPHQDDRAGARLPRRRRRSRGRAGVRARGPRPARPPTRRPRGTGTRGSTAPSRPPTTGSRRWNGVFSTSSATCASTGTGRPGTGCSTTAT